MANCDFGNPCDCSDCRTTYIKINCPICISEHTIAVVRESKWVVDRKGIGEYSFIESELTKDQMTCTACK